AILRVADGLDREHRQKVRSLDAAVRRGTLELRPKVSGPFALERWALESKSSLFRETFGLAVKLEVETKAAERRSKVRA
ncbi:MAG TPA: Ppx/GppA family phosphatase, partial [Planctomycetota bacterium]|nr:Ppx/GppA family phosphatase [Planctomycetota bacterium]